jgi:uncharacterized protein (DUF433 family)
METSTAEGDRLSATGGRRRIAEGHARRCGLLFGSASWSLPVTPKSKVFHSDPEILGGIPVFVGTRVPVKNLFDYLEGGDRLEDFLDQFPSVTREQAIAALELAEAALTASAHPPR